MCDFKEVETGLWKESESGKHKQERESLIHVPPCLKEGFAFCMEQSTCLCFTS